MSLLIHLNLSLTSYYLTAELMAKFKGMIKEDNWLNISASYWLIPLMAKPIVKYLLG